VATLNKVKQLSTPMQRKINRS